MLTGADLDDAWMPTLSADQQAILATDKVRFQGQEVAFVVADDRYSARDALELIEVDYELLPAVVDARARARARRARDPRRRARPDRQPRLRLGGRRRGRDRGGVRARRRGRRRAGDALPALAPGADGDLRRARRLRPRQRQADRLVHDPGAARAPHAVLARHRAAGAPHPGHLARRRRRLRQQGAGLSRLPVRDRRGAAARAPGEVGRGPLREPDVDRLRARLRDARADRGDAGGQAARRSAST